TGLSSIVMAQGLHEAGVNFKITTIDIFEPWQSVGKKQIKQAGYESQIECILGDSLDVLPKLIARGDKWGLCFVDGCHLPDHAEKEFRLLDEHVEVFVFHDIGRAHKNGLFSLMKKFHREGRFVMPMWGPPSPCYSYKGFKKYSSGKCGVALVAGRWAVPWGSRGSVWGGAYPPGYFDLLTGE
ncbi:unnamed protein product, partial [marine sediment metagenome]